MLNSSGLKTQHTVWATLIGGGINATMNNDLGEWDNSWNGASGYSKIVMIKLLQSGSILQIFGSAAEVLKINYDIATRNHRRHS